MRIFSEAARLEQQNCPFALAQIVKSQGSTPRRSAEMIVLPDGKTMGTIGGGMLERLVIEQAAEAIAQRKSRVFHGRMTRSGEDAVGADCGGMMEIFISVHGMRSRLVLVGAGHVNRAVAAAAAVLGFDLHVMDSYPESLQADRFPVGTQLIHLPNLGEACARIAIEADDFVLIATNSNDLEALQYFIQLPLRYLGLLASRRKVLEFKKTLRLQGVAEDALQRLHAPVGLNIGAETPEEIAISVLAEMLQVKHRIDVDAMQDPPEAKRGELVVIRGAGDIASGVAIRLVRCGYRVVMLEIAQPTAIRRSAAFAQAVFDESFTVEDLTARLVATAQEALDLTLRGEIALLVDPQAGTLAALSPNYLVDAILAKENLGTHKTMAPITIALGPGFTAGDDCDAVIETNRGHRLGRVILSGSAEPNTGIPGEIAGKSDLRVVRAPCAGVFRSSVALGDLIVQGALMGQVGDTAVTAPLTGMVRGLLQDGLQVTARFKIGDINPRGAKADYLSASDKAMAIGGGVLEAMLRLREKVSA